MAYNNITIGTEQELGGVEVLIKRSDGDVVTLDTHTKTLVEIWDDKENLLVNVTADASRGGKRSDGFYPFQLEFNTPPGKSLQSDEKEKGMWNKKKEAIEFFVREFVFEGIAKGTEYNEEKIQERTAQLGSSYQMKFNAVDGREIKFCKINKALTFCNQMTVGIDEEDFAAEFNAGRLNDKKIWDILWFKDCTNEISHLEGISLNEKEKAAYSYICSILDWSAHLYVKNHPEKEDFDWKVDQNHTLEKNQWGVLPRRKIVDLIDYFKINKPQIYKFLTERTYQNKGISGEKESIIYHSMMTVFWKYYRDQGNYLAADFLLRAGVLPEAGQYLFEYRSVRIFIEGIYEDSGDYLCKLNLKSMLE